MGKWIEVFRCRHCGKIYKSDIPCICEKCGERLGSLYGTIFFRNIRNCEKAIARKIVFWWQVKDIETYPVECFDKRKELHIHILTKADIGRWVVFDGKKGRIKSWNDHYVFVVFHCNDDWENYADYTAEAVHPSRLEFKEKMK